jgi:hypothetical protein
MVGRAIGRRQILAGAGMAALAAPGIALAQGEAIRIGEINSYTAQPAFLQPYRNAWILAQEQVNAAGGIIGRRMNHLPRRCRAAGGCRPPRGRVGECGEGVPAGGRLPLQCRAGTRGFRQPEQEASSWRASR